ncbi:MAG: bifunctional nuclease family protein [Desulfobacterales bacterium]|nr:bifunctional nuclease family protein [Desulfobacterales bacterium]
MYVEVKILGLTVDSSSNTPVLILQSISGTDILSIWIGLIEAASIVSALQNKVFERPMTHDLFKQFVDYLNIRVSKIEVTDLVSNTYYGRIHFATGDHSFSLEARPSDAIAMAIRYNAPIFVAQDVFDKIEKGNDAYEMMDKSERGKQWAKILEEMDPDQFGKYKI